MRDGFVWGVASAAYQTEGAAFEDGKGASVWDVFSHTPGKTRNGDTGDEACDAYHRVDGDLDLLASLGIRNYRFSVSWPRVFPAGEGALNPAGPAFYDRVVNGCLARGIEPWVTLYHWDLPERLQERFGGWQSRKTAEAFAAYAGVVAAHFRGRVRRYFVLTEPQCFITLGYGTGVHAPGLRLPEREVLCCWHNALLAYGLAARALRAADPGAEIGLASTGKLCYPERAADTEAARALSFRTTPETVGFCHQMLLDPVCFGRCPEGVSLGAAGDMELICQPPDFIGLNIYHGSRVRDGAETPWEAYTERTAMGWPVTPEILYYGPKFIYERYGLPLVISENGASFRDAPSPEGSVRDPARVSFLERCLAQLERAVDDGIPVRGYFHWSFTDNFEWSDGYDERFGLVYVDYKTQKRIPKESADWFSGKIKKQS